MESFEITRPLPPVRILGRVEDRSSDGTLERSWDIIGPVIDDVVCPTGAEATFRRAVVVPVKPDPSQSLDASVSTGSLRRSRTASVVQIPGLLHAPGFVPQALRSLGPEGATQATATDRRLVRPEEI